MKETAATVPLNCNRFGILPVATLKDISDELGVSVATVSRALNGFPEVNARTRNRGKRPRRDWAIAPIAWRKGW